MLLGGTAGFPSLGCGEAPSNGGAGPAGQAGWGHGAHAAPPAGAQPAQELLWFGLVCALSPCKIAGWGFVRVFVFACFLIIEVIGACYRQNTL